MPPRGNKIEDSGNAEPLRNRLQQSEISHINGLRAAGQAFGSYY